MSGCSAFLTSSHASQIPRGKKNAFGQTECGSLYGARAGLSKKYDVVAAFAQSGDRSTGSEAAAATARSSRCETQFHWGQRAFPDMCCGDCGQRTTAWPYLQWPSTAPRSREFGAHLLPAPHLGHCCYSSSPSLGGENPNIARKA